MFDEEGNLTNYSEGEDPKVNLHVNWDKVTTVEDIKDVLKPIFQYMTMNLSDIDENTAKMVLTLFDKEILEHE
jgi:L-rhamnose isomerase